MNGLTVSRCTTSVEELQKREREKRRKNPLKRMNITFYCYKQTRKIHYLIEIHTFKSKWQFR